MFTQYYANFMSQVVIVCLLTKRWSVLSPYMTLQTISASLITVQKRSDHLSLNRKNLVLRHHHRISWLSTVKFIDQFENMFAWPHEEHLETFHRIQLIRIYWQAHFVKHATFSTRYKWNTGTWSKCTAYCGAGTQDRPIRCLDTYHNQHVSNSACRDSPPPKASKNCFSKTCTNHSFVTQTWSTCSKTCGVGVQRRNVRCAAQDQPAAKVPLASCTGEFPVTARYCNNRPCRTYEWVSLNSGSCSVSCGGGVQFSSVSCKHWSTGSSVNNHLCQDPKPDIVALCNSFPC